MTAGRQRVGILSLVHPDLLPAVHAMAELLSEMGAEVDIFCASSTVEADGSQATYRVHQCGPLDGTLGERRATRRKLRDEVVRWTAQRTPSALIACCPFSFLEALNIAPEGVPVAYWVFELYDGAWSGLARAPLTVLRNRRALRRMREARIVCAPSSERAGWLLRAANLDRLPTVILNCPVFRQERVADSVAWPSWLPERFRESRLVLNSGNIGPTHGVPELVASVRDWPADVGLVVTNVTDSAHGRALRDAAASSPRRDDIHLLPPIARADLLTLQRLATVGVCLLRRTSALETIMPAPNKVAEYVHAGLVVLGFDNDLMRRLAAEELAVVIEERPTLDLADAITRALAVAADGHARERAKRVASDWYDMRVQGEPLLRAVLGAAS